MNKEDEYAFFIMLALLETDQRRLYFFNPDKKQLFGLIKTDYLNYEPIYRNSNISPNEKVLAKIAYNRDLINFSIPKVVELPRIMESDKRKLLEELGHEIKDETSKNFIYKNLDMLISDRPLWITSTLNVPDFSVTLLFDKSKYLLVEQKYYDLYAPLGINEEAELLW